MATTSDDYDDEGEMDYDAINPEYWSHMDDTGQSPWSYDADGTLVDEDVDDREE